MLPVLILVYFFNLLFFVLLVSGIWYHFSWWLLLVLWAGKTIVELPFFVAVSGFYRMRWTVPLLFLFQPFHITYTILAGLLGQFRTYEWKGRKVS
jgi:biofilm PGA synthesis N-glycosyltransferase PgaC